MKKITMIMLCLILLATFFVLSCEGESEGETPAPEDIAANQQPPGEHSVLCTSDGYARDDEVADYLAEMIPKDEDGVPQVKDVKIIINSCNGGGFADDFERIFGPGGECEGVPWVFGSASGASEGAYGRKDGPGTGSGFGSHWTDALAGEQSSPSNPTPGSMRDDTSGNVLEDLETAGTNDIKGPNHQNKEHPEVACGNGGADIQWDTPGTKHEAIIFIGRHTGEMDDNDAKNMEDSLEDLWSDSEHNIQVIIGGTGQDLADAITEACDRLDSNTQLALYFSDHGKRSLDFDEFLEWEVPYHIGGNYSIEFDLDAGWEHSLTTLVNQGDEVSPFLLMELSQPLNSEEWTIALNKVPIPLPSGNLTGELELAVNWTSLLTGPNHLEMTFCPEVPYLEVEMECMNLELYSGPIAHFVDED